MPLVSRKVGPFLAVTPGPSGVDIASFYLRVVDEAPWLRGFMCDDLHVMGADDRWVLSAPTSAP